MLQLPELLAPLSGRHFQLVDGIFFEDVDLDTSMATFQGNTSSSSEIEESPQPDEIRTPIKKRYKRSLHHGFSEKRAAYHKFSNNIKFTETPTRNNNSQSYESSETTEESSEFDEIRTPFKKKYKRSLHHGFSEKMAAYHKLTYNVNIRQPETSSNVQPHWNSPGTMDVDHESGLTSDSTSTSDSEDTISESEGYTSESDSNISESFTEQEENTREDLNVPFFETSKHSVKSAYTIIMMFVTKNLSSREGFSDLLLMLKDILPDDTNLTTSVYKMKESLKKGTTFQEPKIHYFCGDCQSYLEPDNICTNDMCRRNSASVGEFYDLKLLDQLKILFRDEHFSSMIVSRQRLQRPVGQITDITDGDLYKSMTANNGTRLADITMTFTMNTDGVSLFSSSKQGSLWPVYLAINELPIKMRFSRKYLLTCLLHCRDEKPNMLTYLSPLMKDLNLLHDEGIKVTTSGRSYLLKAHVIAFATDLPARAIVLNMKQFNGKSSCSMCLDEGSCPPGRPLQRFYPFKEDSLERTHQSMLDNAVEACRSGNAVNGIKGASALMSLKYIDIPKCFVIDWMHNVLLGVVKALLNFWLNNVHRNREFYIGNKIFLLNQRLQQIQIPDFISRRQRGLEEHSRWKASECREWLIHFSMPVLYGVLKPYPLVHYSLLVTAMSLLTKDVISPNEIDLAEQLLLDFTRQYPFVYGETSQTMNIHMLRHLANFTRLHGPLFCYSCFGFESMNAYLKKMVHGTRFINNQVSFAIAMSKQLSNLLKIFDDGDEKTKRLVNQLGSKLLRDCKDPNNKTSVLGKEKLLQITDRNIDLLTPHMQARSPTSFVRIQMGGNTFHSKGYHQAKTRNNFCVTFEDNHEEKLGAIMSYIKTGNQMYAVMEEFEVTGFSFDDDTKSELQNSNLSHYMTVQLCPHIFRITGQQDKKLVPVGQLRKKCIFSNITRGVHLKFISKPPNVVEHG